MNRKSLKPEAVPALAEAQARREQADTPSYPTLLNKTATAQSNRLDRGLGKGRTIRLYAHRIEQRVLC